MTEADASGVTPMDQGDAVATMTKQEKRQKAQDLLTKRQRRKQTNDTHAWPQHPKITSPAARARAYIRTAGLNAGKKTTSESLDPQIDLQSPQVKFGRLLGATDQRVRHNAVIQLSAYLKARCDINNEAGGLSELDLLKLWKGLWYTLYMADKVPVQDELSAKIAELIWCVAGTEEEDEYAGKAYLDMFGDEGDIGFESDEDDDDDDEVQMEEIANTLGEDEDDSFDGDEMDSAEDSNSDQDGEEEEGNHCDDENCEDEHHHHGEDSEDDEDMEELNDSEIPHCRGAHLASLFAKTFFATVRREWGKMDKYRVDKFYTLMRLMLQQVYKYMALRHWNMGIIRLFNDALYEEVLSQTPNGLRFHLIDIALDELATVQAEAPMPLTEATFLDCMEPFFAMAQTGAGGDDIVQARAVENILNKFLVKYSVVSERADDDDDEDENRLIFGQVHVQTVSQFIFEIASDAETTDRYRKSLYDLHKEYMRALKKAGHDVDIDNSGKVDDAIDEDDAGTDEVESDDHDMLEADENEPESKTEKRKRQKKERKDSKKEVADEKKTKENGKKTKADEKKTKKKEVATEKDLEIPKADEKKKKKHDKKNKKGKSSETAAHTNAEGGDSEEITISVEEQKVAKEAMQPKRKTTEGNEGSAPGKKRQKQQGKSTGEGASPKERNRVSFNKKNQARSWKASMKGLHTMDVPPTPDVTPEKGILRKKSPTKSNAPPKGKAGKRKKATDYFR